MCKRPKKYLCSVDGCGKMYSRPCLLEQHRRSHTNERPFVCKEPGCGKGFLRDSHLKVHRWSHSKVKPLTCPVCFKGFITNQQLSRHSKTHKNLPSPPQEQEADGHVEQKESNARGNESMLVMCTYNGCKESFPVEVELTNHILDVHLRSEILSSPILRPAPVQTSTEDLTPISLSQTSDDASQNGDEVTVSSQTDSMSGLESDDTNHHTQSSSRQGPYSAPWDNWDSLYCKEVECAGYPKYESLCHLLEHYDRYHTFVPESLVQCSFQGNDSSGGLTNDSCSHTH